MKARIWAITVVDGSGSGWLAFVRLEQPAAIKSLEMWIAPPNGGPQMFAQAQLNNGNDLFPSTITPANEVALGNGVSAGGVNTHFNGVYGGFFKINKAITPEQMFALACGKDIVADLGESPLINYPFNTGSSATMADASGRGNTLTRQGAPTDVTIVPSRSGNIISHISDAAAVTRFFPYDPASGNAYMDLKIAYLGTASTPQYRVVNDTTGVAAIDWTNVSTSMPYTATPSVVTQRINGIPKSTNLYRIETRAGSLAQTALPQSNKIGSGFVVMSTGQSLNVLAYSGGGSTITGPRSDISIRGTGGATLLAATNVPPIAALADSLVTALGCVVEVVNAATTGTGITDSNGWATTTSVPWTNFVNIAGQIGNRVSSIYWEQGQNQGTQTSPAVTAANEQSGLNTVFGRMRTLVGLPNLKISMSICGPQTYDSGTAPNAATYVPASRQTVVGYSAATGDTNAFVGMDETDMQIYNLDVHALQANYQTFGRRQAVSQQFAMGLAANPGVGPRITGVTYSGSTATVTFAHTGGTDLVFPSTARRLNGLEFSTDNFATTIPYTATSKTNATQVAFTLGSAPSGTLKVRYGYNQAVTDTGFIRLGTTPIAIASGSSVVTVTTPSAHGLAVGDLVSIGGISTANAGGLNAQNISKMFAVASVPTTTTLTIDTGVTASASGNIASNSTLRIVNILHDNNVLTGETLGQPVQFLMTS